MPPFNESNMYLAQNERFNSNIPANATCPDDASAHQISWQSAFWPVMACSLAVLLQETGRVANAPFRYSYALRASPYICAIDTFLMLLKLVVMLMVGCSPLNAVRHVWYDRFEEDEDISIRSALQFMWREYWEAKQRISVGAGDTASLAVLEDHLHPAEDDYMCSGALPISNTRGISLNDLECRRTIIANESAEPIQTTILRSDLDFDDAEFMCSGALPVIGNEGGALVDLSPDASRISDTIPITQSSRPDTVPTSSVDQTEISTSQGLGGEDGTVTLSGTSIAIEDQFPNSFVDEATAIAGPPLDRPSTLEDLKTYMVTLPGSNVDHSWRISMVSFIFGALPQAVKVFAMKGIWGTQALVGILVISFVVSEAFRSLAGPVGQFNLHPMPIVLRAKKPLSSKFLALFPLLIVFYHMTLGMVGPVVWTFPGPDKNRLFIWSIPVCMLFALAVTNRLLKVVGFISRFKACAGCLNSTRSCVGRFKLFDGLRTRLLLFVSSSLALSPSRARVYFPFATLCLGYFAGMVGGLWWCSSVYERQGYQFSEAVVYVSAAFGVVITPPSLLIMFYVLYRLVFASPLSSSIHYLCGIEGTLDEYATGVFILINLFNALFHYSFRWNEEHKPTFKPGWTETLG